MKFYDDISVFYEEIFPLDQKKVAFVEKRLEKGDRVLDIGCATGELLFNLKEISGYGIDLDEKMIAFAKKRGGVSKYKVMNMTDIHKEFAFKFDSILCTGNTLVHLKNSAEVFSFFKKVKNLLKNSGSFIIQIINYDYVSKNKVASLPLIESDKIIFERHYLNLKEKESVEFKTKLSIKENNQVFKNSIKLFPIQKTELEDLLRKAGFENLEFFSGFDEKPWKEESMRTVVYTK